MIIKNNKLDLILDFFEQINEEKVVVKTVTAYGYQSPGKWISKVHGNISLYYFDDLHIEEMIAPLTNQNRPGDKKKSTEFIVVHDTASMASSATALAHAKYVFNGGEGTSWGYSVGDDNIYRQIPDDEVSYHAGDGLKVIFKLRDTNVVATNKNPVITINNGFYFINGEKSAIEIPKVSFEKNSDGIYYWTSDGVSNGRLYNELKANPETDEQAQKVVDRFPLTTHMINDAGLFTTIGKNGNYYMGPTYFNGTYKYISNRGGNLNSIGMETMVNEGSDLYLTWTHAAKLCAKLCLENMLDPTRVKPHHFFSGKPCPMTLRENGLWNQFMKMVNAEYYVLKNLSNYKISFTSNNLEYVDNHGRVIKDVKKEVTVSYTITIEYDGTSASRTFYSKICPN